DMTVVGDTLIFSTGNYASSTVDYQLWAAGPGSTSATMLDDFQNSSVFTIASVGGTAYLSVAGKLWTSDGTAAATLQVKDNSNNPVTAPTGVFSFQGQVYYVSDLGTSSTIGVLSNGVETPTITGLPTSISVPVVAGTFLYFTASPAGNSGQQTVLW